MVPAKPSSTKVQPLTGELMSSSENGDPSAIKRSAFCVGLMVG